MSAPLRGEALNLALAATLSPVTLEAFRAALDAVFDRNGSPQCAWIDATGALHLIERDVEFNRRGLAYAGTIYGVDVFRTLRALVEPIR